MSERERELAHERLIRDHEAGQRRTDGSRQESDRGRVAKTRNVMANKPVIAGTRIRTEAIWNFHQEGYSVKEILDQYPSLTEDDVRAAVEFERKRAASK